MMKVNNTLQFRVDGSKPLSTVSFGDDGIHGFIDAHLSPDKLEVRSADMAHAFMGAPEGEMVPPPFNQHEVGSEAWYDHGKTYGVWVAGVPWKEVEPVLPDPYGPNPTLEQLFHNRGRRAEVRRQSAEKMRSVYTALAAQMQTLNDRFARLEASGISADELGVLARASIEAIVGGRFNLSDDEGDSSLDELGQLYNAQRLHDPDDIARQLSAREDWGPGHRQRLETWFNHGFIEMDKALAEHGIEPQSDAQRRSKAFEDVLADRPNVEKAIQSLPPEARRQAWDYYH
ncbi:MAG: hypothetical protein AAF449_19070, partial [Myxococcota bacterium]